MTSRLKNILIAACVGAAGSCGYSAPYQTQGPSLQNGIAVAVAGERCYVNWSADPYVMLPDDGRLELDLALQVSNESHRTVTISPQEMRLEGPDGASQAIVRPDPAEQLAVPAGQTKEVSLHFSHLGEMDCHHQVALAFDGSVAMGGIPVNMTPIRFIASR